MRKHNKRFAQRWGRDKGDRSSFPQHMAHGFVLRAEHEADAAKPSTDDELAQYPVPPLIHT